jgi:hypothetical protein
MSEAKQSTSANQAKARRIAITLVAVACVAAISIAIYFLTGHRSSPPRAPNPVTNAKAPTIYSPASLNPTPPNALHVGVYLSKYTGDRVGYSCQMTDELQHRGLDIAPILDPGTETDPKIVRLVGVYFLGKHAIDSTSAEALGKLDVIVAPRIWMLRDDARQAIESAVTNGTGLLIRDGLGCMEPGHGPDVSRLSGFAESQFGYNAHPMDCEVIGEHPILGKLSGKIGTIIKITPNGTRGEPAANFTPLIRVKDMDAFRNFAGGSSQWTFYPLYTATLGKGRIVGCQFPAWERVPKDLATAADNEFNLNAVIWLAGRDGGAHAATTRPTTSHAP